MDIGFVFSKIKHYYAHFIALLVFGFHLFFLFADPALNFDFSRGPFTDEGFYLAQLRNYINGHGWGIEKADALLKSPLFAILFYLPLKSFGIHLYIARLFLLLYSLAIWLYIIRHQEVKLWASFFLLLGTTELFVFQYSHYIMPEILCCHVIVLGVFFMYQYLAKNKLLFLLLSGISFSAVWFTKVQFIYILPLPLLLFVWFKFQTKQTSKQVILLHFLILCSTLILFIFAYYFFWYKPHEGFYNYLFIAENKSRIEQPNHMWETIKFYYKHVLLIPEMRFSTHLFWISLASLLFLPYLGKLSFTSKFFLVASIFWFVLELHKLILLYIPLRYIIPLMYVSFLFAAIVWSIWVQFIYQKVKSTRFVFMPILLGLLFASPLLVERIEKLYPLLTERTYSIKNVNHYLRQYARTDKVIVGNWAATTCWEVQNETFPVTHWIINDEKIFTTVFPEIIVAEADEMDSNGAYRNRGIDLSLLSDSSKQFLIGKCAINIWWMKSATEIKKIQDKP